MVMRDGHLGQKQRRRSSVRLRVSRRWLLVFLRCARHDRLDDLPVAGLRTREPRYGSTFNGDLVCWFGLRVMIALVIVPFVLLGLEREIAGRRASSTLWSNWLRRFGRATRLFGAAAASGDAGVSRHGAALCAWRPRLGLSIGPDG
jgi:hypothetical protein